MREVGLLATPCFADWFAKALPQMDLLPQVKRGPRRDDSAILTRYYSLVLGQLLLNIRRHDQILLKVYHIQRELLKRKLGQYTLNGKRHFLLDWIEQQDFSLYTIVQRGSNLNKENTTVTLNFDIMSSLELATIPREVLIEHHDQLNKTQPDNIIGTDIDTDSLSLFIERTRESIKTRQRYSTRQKKMVWANKDWLTKAEANLRQAVQINTLTQDNVLIQPFKFSEFGRLYLGGINLQNCSKTVRHAALGHCYSIDFNVCSSAWKLHTAQRLDPAFVAPYTHSLIRNKQQFRQDLAHVLGDKHLGNAKRILTAIGFGADINSRPWPMQNGTAGIPSIKEIINDEQIEQLKATTWFMDYVNEQTAMNDLIYDRAFVGITSREMVDCVKDKANRVQRSKLLAYLYQKDEYAYLMSLISYITNRFGAEQILLSVHDCVYVKNSFNMAEVNSSLQYINPYLSAEMTEHWGHFEREQPQSSGNKPITEERLRELLQINS